MSGRMSTRRDLLRRWRNIEEEEEAVSDKGGDDPHSHSSRQTRLHQLKEQWFVDCFNFLISMPKENHIWCDSWDLMGPLLETFYNYFKDERQDSPLRILWKRISKDMRTCIRCISQHHQARQLYTMEYESSSIGPLLEVLQNLDEERVTQHLREINERMAKKDNFPTDDTLEVVSIMYEVLMHPVLLDDKSLFSEFETFIEAIDNIHELALDRLQQFPGVYALFFCKRRVRMIAHRLAGSMGKLRRAGDLEPLQVLVKKFVGSLETEVTPSACDSLRPRLQLDRATAWIGIKSLIGFLEPPALEEGILECYPIFLDIVLNQITSDSPVFSHAVTCLKLLFEILGCKLWLRSTLSPSVMCSTLVGQCFHTRNEKIHKEIFELFQPLLQSLEALQDGELEKQRRNFVYFLLHQVPVSSNFSVLIRQKGRQIAFLIIERGYRMNPPCPPFECSHMWGPFLVSTAKDSSLHPSLRQPALDLIQTIIISDAAALVASTVHSNMLPIVNKSLIKLSDAEHDDGPAFILCGAEDEVGPWGAFSSQNTVVSQEYRGWMCIPMLWTDILVEIDPTVLPVSFTKAVFWARSRLLFVSPDRSGEPSLPIKQWLLSSAKEISSSFGWKVPTGSDDGGDGKVSRNAVEASSMCLPLIKTFDRLTAHFLFQMPHGELLKQWTWEPRMSESLILLLADPNDNVRHYAKCILEQVSSTRGLTYGLKFLCSHKCSLSVVHLGLRYALQLLQVQSDPMVLKFQTLQHLFFLIRKLVSEGNLPASDMSGTSSDSNAGKLSSQGGFLRQPVFDSFPVNSGEDISDVDTNLREKFEILLSKAAWPAIQKCLVEGKSFVDRSGCQMTCVRILELLPVVFQKLCGSVALPGRNGMRVESIGDYQWLLDLMDWGKSPLNVVVVYWKRALVSLLSLLKGVFSDASSSVVMAIESLMSSDNVLLDELMGHVSQLSLSLSSEASTLIAQTKSGSHIHQGVSSVEEKPMTDVHLFSCGGQDMQTFDAVAVSNLKDPHYVVISDDELEGRVLSNVRFNDKSDLESNIYGTEPNDCKGDGQKAASVSGVNSLESFHAKETSGTCPSKQAPAVSLLRNGKQDPLHSSRRKKVDNLSAVDVGLHRAKGTDGENQKTDSEYVGKDLSSFQDGVANERINQSFSCENHIMKELVHDIKEDHKKSVVRSVKRNNSSLVVPSSAAPKRQLIQLRSPTQNRTGYLHRTQAGYKRFKPPRLEEWYRAILKVDYFAAVGSSPAGTDDNQNPSKLREVPLCFESAEQYIDVFRPLVLEEFKAQLRSSYLELPSLEDAYCGSLSVLSVDRVDDFHLVRFVHDDTVSGRSFSENDLVLLTKEPIQSPSHEIHMVGKVERREKDHQRKSSILVVRFYLHHASSHLNQARRLLIDRSKWHGSRIMSITPQLREFQALSAVKDIPLQVILNPVNISRHIKDTKPSNLGKLSQPLRRILESSFNDSQLEAISVSINSVNSNSSCCLSLIQGPPGTGKTRTIVAIVSSLLASLQRTRETKISMNENLRQRNISSLKFPQKISESTAIARVWQDAALARQLDKDVESAKKPLDRRGRVLICAQSNAAVDELVARISSEGLYGCDGKMYKPYLVRVGNARTVHPNSLPYFIDTLVDQRLAEEKNLTDARNEISTLQLRANLEKLVDCIRSYEAKRAHVREERTDLSCSVNGESKKADDAEATSDAEIEMKLKEFYDQKRQMHKELSIAQAREKKANEEVRALKHKLRKSLLREAEIVVTTLSGCGGDLYEVCSESMSNSKFGNPSENTLFDAVVIDEAAQALEPASLIPLQLLKSMGSNCIMVGDPKQLPATVLSNLASKFLYECSMFERLQRAGYPVSMLTKQYRMHPEICRFPSTYFYDGKLLNGDKVNERSASFHETKGLGPYLFYDVVDGMEFHGENSGALSFCNEREADAAIELLRFFKRRYPSEFVGGRIGIITPYKSQLSLLRSRFYSAFGSSVTADMEFNTVDGFQGREVDILILSTVRASNRFSGANSITSSAIGFVADVRRMNVALTRAKNSLWILGNLRTLRANHSWAALVDDAKERNLVISIKVPYRSMFDSTCGSRDAHSSVALNDKMKVELNTHCTQRRQNNMKRAVERDAKSVSCAVPKSEKVENKHDISLRTDAPNKKGRANRKDNSLSSNTRLVANEDIKTTNNTVSTPQAPAPESKSRRKECHEEDHNNAAGSKSVNYRKSNKMYQAGKNMDKSDAGEHLDRRISKKQSAKVQENLNSSVPSTVDRLGKRVTGDCGKGPNLVPMQADLSIKRKRQREAIDAILPSSLIPSKKSQASKKALPSKRPDSGTSNVSAGIHPPKRRQVQPVSSKDSLED